MRIVSEAKTKLVQIVLERRAGQTSSHATTEFVSMQTTSGKLIEFLCLLKFDDF